MFNANQTLNSVVLIGRLGKHPETRYTAKGTAVIRLSIATHSRVPDASSGGWKNVTEWHRAVIFGRDAAFWTGKLQQGDLVQVTGSLRHQVYTNAEGATFRWTEVYANQFQRLAGKAPVVAKKEEVTQEELALIPSAEETYEAKPEDVQTACATS